MFICVQCGCHLQSSFRFCPKCGMQVSGPSQGGGESHAQDKKPAASSRFQTTLKTFPNFEKYKSLKEKDRRAFDNRSNTRKKKRIEVESVIIRVGVMNHDMTTKRGETLPVKVPSDATSDAIADAAVVKHTAFNKRFQRNADYHLMFKDGSEVKFVPGTSPVEPFTLKRYKEESGFGYSKITFFIRPVGNIVQDVQQIVETDSDTSTDDGNFVKNAKKPVFLEKESSRSEVNTVEQSDGPSCSTAAESQRGDVCEVQEREPEVSLLVHCPTCSVRFPVAQIEEHADLCADFLLELPDPNQVRLSSPGEEGMYRH